MTLQLGRAGQAEHDCIDASRVAMQTPGWVNMAINSVFNQGHEKSDCQGLLVASPI